MWLTIFSVIYLHFSSFPALISRSMSCCCLLFSVSLNWVQFQESFCYIILSVLKIHSAFGRFKAFSICTFYLNVVDIFQGTLLFMNFQPTSSYSPDQDKMTSLFYTFVIPMLNPLIYSLWNKNIKETLEKLKNKLCLIFLLYIVHITAHI